GAGLARGYLGRPAATAERFVPDPFASEPGARMYRTGDLARWGAEGRLEFLGRRDRQVKVRGFRVEPAEIEATLSRHPAGSGGVVVASEEKSGGARLIAYVVAEEAALGDVRAFLRARLPEHLVPAVLVAIAEVPRLPNGKADPRALPPPPESRP